MKNINFKLTLLIFLTLLILFLKNLILIFLLLNSIFIFLVFTKISLKNFFDKLDKLSPFCISIFVSYILISFFKQDINLIFLYSLDATVVILKIIDILFLNIFLQEFKIKEKLFSKVEILNFILKKLPEIEKNFFEILHRYDTRLKKLKNIDTIITDFFILSLKEVKNGAKT